MINILKTSISILFAAATVASGTFVIQPSIADSSSSALAPSILKRSVVNRTISESEVLAAQKAWGEALVAISTTYETKGIQASKALAGKVIDAAYGYQFGPVLFKPTLTVAPQTFRTPRAGSLAYFVGGDPAFPMDRGFALNGWRKVEIKNSAIFISGNTATTMGNVMSLIRKVRLLQLIKLGSSLKMITVSCGSYCTTPHCLMQRNS